MLTALRAASARRRYIRRPLPGGTAWTSPVDVCVVCPSYPGEASRYGGQFVQVRVDRYCAKGLSVVVVVARADTVADVEESVAGTPVWRTASERLARYLSLGHAARVVLHHPELHSWQAVRPAADCVRPLVIHHGYESRPWRTLESSYTAEQLVALAPELDRRDAARRETLREIWSTPSCTPVFVSKFLKGVAERFCDRPAPAHSEVIHNPVDPERFPARVREADERFHILWVRSFNSFNYGNDLARDAVLAMSRRPDFSRYTITVRGDGPLWDDSTAPLAHLSNVDLQRGFVGHGEMAALHARHGILLVPSRWESQGLTLGEGMSSGLVCVTTEVAAVPEFVSDREGRVCPPEDAQGLCDAIVELGGDPVLFQHLSVAAAKRAARQCALSVTVDREIEQLQDN